MDPEHLRRLFPEIYMRGDGRDDERLQGVMDEAKSLVAELLPSSKKALADRFVADAAEVWLAAQDRKDWHAAEKAFDSLNRAILARRAYLAKKAPPVATVSIESTLHEFIEDPVAGQSYCKVCGSHSILGVCLAK